MLTVPEAARRAGRDPETVRRWIRAGRLRSHKVGTQHLIEEQDLEALLDDHDDMLPLPDEWRFMSDGQPQPNWVRIIRRSREGH
jgi:excisionase family DNA binding protein